MDNVASKGERVRERRQGEKERGGEGEQEGGREGMR